MKCVTASVWLAFIFFSACGPTAKVTSDKDFADSVTIKSVFVIVVSDAATGDCMKYYESFFVDSLKKYGLNASGTFFCCRDNTTDMKELVNSLLPANANFQNVLAIVMFKVTTGYGTSSARELQIQLYNVGKNQITWNGKLSANFSWFVSDANYQSVAHKMTNSTLDALKYQGIIDH